MKVSLQLKNEVQFFHIVSDFLLFERVYRTTSAIHVFFPQGDVRPEGENQEVARAGRELNQELNRLMVAMRDMLANIQFQEPPREDNPELRDEDEWD